MPNPTSVGVGTRATRAGQAVSVWFKGMMGSGGVHRLSHNLLVQQVPAALLTLLLAGLYTGCEPGDPYPDLLSDKAHVRQDGIARLRDDGMTDALAQLIAALGKEDKRSEKAMRALTEIGGAAVPALVARITEPPPAAPAVSEDDMPHKESAKSRAHDAAVRVKAIKVLGEIGDQRAVPVLVNILSQYVDPLYSWDYGIMVPAASDALVEIGAPAARELLMRYSSEDDPAVTEVTNSTLSRITQKAGIAPLVAEIGDPKAGKGVVRFVMLNDDHRFVDELITLLNESAAPRYDAALALEQMGGEKAEAAVKAFATSVNAESLARNYRSLLQKSEDNMDLLLFLFAIAPSQQMADDFLSSGNTRLEDTAAQWERVRQDSGVPPVN